MKYAAVLALFVLLAPPALASRDFDDKGSVRRWEMREPPKQDVIACTTLKGIREVQQIRGYQLLRFAATVRAVNASVRGAGCVYFPSVDYVELEEIVEHIQMTGKIRLELRYTRVIVMHRPNETFYIGNGFLPTPLLVWDITPDDAEESY